MERSGLVRFWRRRSRAVTVDPIREWLAGALQEGLTAETMRRNSSRGLSTVPGAIRRASRTSLLSLFFALLVLPAGSSEAGRSRVADPPSAPAFELPTGSSTVKLEDLRGKVVLVDFWASWCGPCRESFPWMNELAKRDVDRGLVIVAINLDKDRRAAEAFLRRNAPAFVVAFDPAGKTADDYHVDAMPKSFLVSRTGRLVDSHSGFYPKETASLEERIEEEVAK